MLGAQSGTRVAFLGDARRRHFISSSSSMKSLFDPPPPNKTKQNKKTVRWGKSYKVRREFGNGKALGQQVLG